MGALPEMWDAMHSWFTPSVLFLVLNLVIGTIAFTSALRTPKPPHQQQTNNTAKLSNTPSFLHRVTSFNFNTQHSQAIPSQPQPDEPKQAQEVEAEAEQVQVQDQDNEDERVQEEVVEREEEVEITVALGRSKSDAQPLADLRPPPLPSRLKKSGTVDSPFAHFVLLDRIEGDEQGQGQGQDQDVHVGDKEDDFKAKADSFIRGFKEQLKLQRNESFLRYRAMLHRGTHS